MTAARHSSHCHRSLSTAALEYISDRSYRMAEPVLHIIFQSVSSSVSAGNGNVHTSNNASTRHLLLASDVGVCDVAAD